jgi:hypothetical protein
VDGGPADCLDRGRYPQVIGPGVVTPPAHQVGLVDGHQDWLQSGQGCQDVAVGQLLRGQENEVRASVGGGQPIQVFPALAGRLRRVDRHCIQLAARVEGAQLIPLQRDKGRNDDDRPRQQRPGQLVDRRLPAASGQDGEGVVAGQHTLDRVPLAGSHRRVAKQAPRRLQDRVLGGPGARAAAVECPEGGLRYIDVWESEDDWDRFAEERLHPVVHPLLQGVFGEQLPPEPERLPLTVIHTWVQAS